MTGCGGRSKRCCKSDHGKSGLPFVSSSMMPGTTPLYSARSRLVAVVWIPNRVTGPWRWLSPMRRTRYSTNARRSRCGGWNSGFLSLDILGGSLSKVRFGSSYGSKYMVACKSRRRCSKATQPRRRLRAPGDLALSVRRTVVAETGYWRGLNIQPWVSFQASIDDPNHRRAVHLVSTIWCEGIPLLSTSFSLTYIWQPTPDFRTVSTVTH